MNISKQHKPHNGSRHINITSISPPPLIPAPHLVKKELNGSSHVHRNTSSTLLNERISWANLHGQHNDDAKKSLTDAYLEIECLKSTLMATNEILSSNEEEMKRLEAKAADLELKMAEEKAFREHQMVELERLQKLVADSAKIQEAHRTEIVNLEAEVNRLRAECAKHPVVSDRSVGDTVDKMPMKKRKKMLHECTHCDYSTFRANAMKTHRQEGCRNAVVEKFFSCDVCKGKFTYNTYRFHLNQYTKKSNHAKNGHQNYSPAQHRQMLEKLKQTKQ